MFAVVGYFDKDSDKIIKSLWQGMADSGVCDYLINSANNPHIKFAVFVIIPQNMCVKSCINVHKVLK